MTAYWEQQAVLFTCWGHWGHCLLGCDAVHFVHLATEFLRNLLPPSSELKSFSSKRLQSFTELHVFTCQKNSIFIHLYKGVSHTQPVSGLRRWSIICTFHARTGKHHFLLNLSNDAGEEICTFYTGISHTGRSTKESWTHVLGKHLAYDDTRKGNTVLYDLGDIAQGRLSHSLYTGHVFPDWALEPSPSALSPRDRLRSNLSTFSSHFCHEDVCRNCH